MIRKAIIADARAIHKLLLNYARDGLVLPRSLSEIYEQIRDFYVFIDDERVLGAVALNICWEDLAEVRSLVVEANHMGKGIGRRLVEACLSEARQLGLKQIFALTYEPEFFERLDFHKIDKAELPQKIWGDCLKCAKFPDCDEIAMSLTLLNQEMPPGSTLPATS
ncbi:MAG: N-acetyltransferase [Deltaproteobacteria bacterium]|jgi:amino-acid N-acetyltransferase|nr:N-acetyltransferase [Deltaproteobacteria bacterium]MBW2505323.1 N-acetyltransferase [Deltaproteobacteria bacterium]MBW2520000.1 N-acetyltransferase [Deltaproteobacteria bacterium]